MLGSLHRDSFQAALPSLESPVSSTLVQKRSKSSFSKFLGRSRNASLSSIGESDAVSFASPQSQAPSVFERTVTVGTPATSLSLPSLPNSPTFRKGNSSKSVEEADTELPRFLYRTPSRQSETAEDLQRSTPLRHRAVWIARDREAYKSAVQNITISNDLIESLLRCHVLRVIDRRFRQEQSVSEQKPAVEDQIPEDDARCIQSLAHMYEALPGLSQFPSIAGKLEYGLRISFNHAVTKESILEDFPNLDLHPDSSIYLLQARPLEGQRLKESFLLLAEALDASFQDEVTPWIDGQCYPFEHLADLSVHSRPSGDVRVLRDTTSWTELMTLEDLFASEEAEPAIKARVALAALLAKSHLHISGLNGRAGNWTPRAFRFFDLSSEAGSTAPADIIRNEDFLLNLYHFSDLAKPPPKSSTRGLGGMKTTKPSFDASVVDLGLLLYQIGCWKQLSTDHTGQKTSHERLKEEVYSNIHELYRKVGLRFAETVQSCLQWDTQLPRAKAANQAQFYRDVVTPLLDLKLGCERTRYSSNNFRRPSLWSSETL